MAAGTQRSDSAGRSNPTSLGHKQSIESELVQRNREIAKVRDLLRQRELEISDWKARHSELVGRLSDVDGELTKTKARHKRDSVVGAAPAPDIVAEASGLRAEVAARKQELDNMREEHSKQFEKLRRELSAERSSEKAALEAKDEQLEKLRRELSAELSSAKAALEAEDERLEKVRRELSAERSSAKAALEAKDDQLEKLRRELFVERSSAKAALEAEDEHFEKLRHELSAERNCEKAALEAKDEQLEKLRRELSAERSSAKAALEARDEHLEKLRRDLSAERCSAKAASEAKDEQLEKLRRELSAERRSAKAALEAEDEHMEKLRRELSAERSSEKAALEAKDDALREVAEIRREKNRFLEAASKKATERDLEMARQDAELAASRTEVARLTKKLEQARSEIVDARREKDSSSEAASQRMSEHDLEIARLGAELQVATKEINQLRSDLEDARSETTDALERANEAQAHFEASHAQQWRDLHASWETARIATDRAEDLEERLATERHGIALQLSALEEQLSCERRARRESEEGRIVISTDLKEALEGLNATTAQLKVSEASSLVHLKEVERLRLEGSKLADRVVSLEEQLRAASQFESRSRALQTECSGLRSEVKLLRRQCQELHEGFAMVAEESRTQKLEAASHNATLQLQLEETRRARSLEMHALVTKMCAVGATGGTKEEC